MVEAATIKEAGQLLDDEFQKCLFAGDVEGAASFYAPNAVMVVHGKDHPYYGREAIKEVIAGLLQFGIKDNETIIHDAQGHDGGDIATAFSTCLWKDGKGNPLFRINYGCVGKKIGKLWYMTQDYSNIDALDVRGELIERGMRWNQLYAKGDMDKLIDEMYTENVSIGIPGHPMIKGRSELKKMMDHLHDPSLRRIKPKLGEIDEIDKDTVVESGGEITLVDIAGNTVGKRRSLTVWKRVNGKFCVHASIMNPMACD